SLTKVYEGRSFTARVGFADNVALSDVKLFLDDQLVEESVTSDAAAILAHEVTIPIGDAGRTLSWRAEATEREGNPAVGGSLQGVVLPDSPPNVSIDKLTDHVRSYGNADPVIDFRRAHVQPEDLVVLEGSLATLTGTITDDTGIRSRRVIVD